MVMICNIIWNMGWRDGVKIYYRGGVIEGGMGDKKESCGVGIGSGFWFI